MRHSYKFLLLVIVVVLIPLGFLLANENASPGKETGELDGEDTYFEKSQEDNRTADADVTLLGGVTQKNLSTSKDELQPISNDNPQVLHEWYIDEEGTQYGFDKETGEYSGFIKPDVYEGPTQPDKYDVEEMKVIADAAVSQLVDISKYEEQLYFHQEDTGVHKFNYYRIINGYRTTECGSVFLTQAGTIELLLFSNIGKFDDVAVPAIDEAQMDSQLDEKIKLQIDDSIIEYAIKDRILDYNDGSLVMIYSVECTTEKGYVTLEMVEITIE